MKRQYTPVIFLWTTLGLFGAAGTEPDKIVKEAFEEAKLAIVTGRPGALDGLSSKIISEHQERVKQLLEYALRSTHENSKEYVDQLVDILKTGSKRSSESLTLMDIAIMQGNEANVKKLLEIKPDLSTSRLISDHKIVSTEHALALLIERKRNNETVYGGPRINATLEQLEQIKLLIDKYNNDSKKRSFSLPNIFRKKK